MSHERRPTSVRAPCGFSRRRDHQRRKEDRCGRHERRERARDSTDDNSPIAVGDRVTLNVYVSGDETRTVDGTVTREETLDKLENPMWRNRIAIALDEPDEAFAATILSFANKQKRGSTE